MCQLNHNFINSVSIEVLETIHWSENELVSDPTICNNSPSDCSKSSSTSHGNPPILQSIYPILDKFNINTSNLDDTHLDVIFLKNLLSEVNYVLIDNNMNINLEKWGGRGRTELIQFPSIGHLKYDRIKQNVKQNNFIEQT